MDITIFEIMKDLKNLNQENYVNLFLESKFIINKKHLLLLSTEEITLQKGIFEDLPHSKYIFTQETLALVLKEDFFSQKFSTKELLNIFANQNRSLIRVILDLKIFENIYIINDIESYEAEGLNIRQDSDLSFELLEDKKLKEQILIKYLINEKGEINLRHIDHLQNCLSFMNPRKITINRNFLNFFLNAEKSLLKKITKRFNLKKILCSIYDQYKACLLNQQTIENLIILNGDFIDSKVLDIIMKNYYLLKDENHKWLKTIFETYDFYFSNLDVAEWMRKNMLIYFESDYLEIEEFHRFAFYDQKVFHIFFSINCFVEEFVQYSHVVNFLNERLTLPLSNDPMIDEKAIICEMIEYILRNKSHPDFHQVACNPERILFKMKEYDVKEYILFGHFNKDFEITLKFQNEDIKSTLYELLNAKNWDDLCDFKQKIIQKKIKIEEILSLNLNSQCEILKSLGISDCSVECSICLGAGKKDTYIFQSCSHFICMTCIEDYINSRGLIIIKKKEKENLMEIFLSNSIQKSLLCPKCKKEKCDERKFHSFF